jgi:hypothetical protein
MSIFSSMRYCLGPPSALGNLWAALVFMPFGLFFDFMDGKVARWRKKSSLMGQELDSLADLVSARSLCVCCLLSSPPSREYICVCMYEQRERGLTLLPPPLDLLRRVPRGRRLRPRPAYARRPPPPVRLRALRADAPRPLQHHGGQRPQGRLGQEPVLRGHADPDVVKHRGADGLLGQQRLDPGQPAAGDLGAGQRVRVPPCRRPFRAQRRADD